MRRNAINGHERWLEETLEEFATAIKEQTVVLVLSSQADVVEARLPELRLELRRTDDAVEQAQLTGAVAALEMLVTTWRAMAAEAVPA